MILAHLDTAWRVEPGLIDLLLAACLLYWLAVGPWRRYVAPEVEEFPRREARWFYSGIAVFYLAVQSPLDPIGEKYLFSAHMLQHNLLMYTIPPMLLLGLPGWLIRPLVSMDWSRTLARVFTHPLVAGVMFNVVFTVWHIPGLYEWALRDRMVHNLEHLMFLGASILMWWPVLSPLQEFPRLSWPGQLVYAFLLAVAQTFVFGFITFSGVTFYPTYEQAPRILDLSPLEDQRLGGVLMKITSMLAFGGMLLKAFFAWYAESEEPRRTYGPGHSTL